MRHPICALLTALLTAWLLVGCATMQTVDTADLPLIDLGSAGSETELDRLSELVARFEAGDLPESVIRVPAGTSLPVGIFIDTPMAHMESGCSRLYVDKEIWLHVRDSVVRVSPDRRRWSRPDDRQRMRELFGYSGGRLSIDLKATRETGAGLSITIQADPIDGGG